MRTLPLLSLLAAALLAAGCGASTLQARESRAEKRGDLVETAITQAERQMEALEPDAAEEHLAKAKKLLAEPDMNLSPDYSLYERRLQEAEQRMPACRAARQKRDHDLAVAQRKAEIEKAQAALDKAMGEIKLQQPSADAIKAAKGELEDLEKALSGGKSLETDKEYLSWAHGVRRKQSEASGVVGIAVEVEQFSSGPGANLRLAREKLAAAKGEKDLQARVDALSAAVDKLRACGEDGNRMIAKSGSLNLRSIVLDAGPTTPAAVLAVCGNELAAADKRLAGEKKALAAFLKKKEAEERAKKAAEEKARKIAEEKERKKKAAEERAQKQAEEKEKRKKEAEAKKQAAKKR